MSAETRLFRQKLASEGLSRQLFEEILAWAEEAPVERLYSDIAGLSARWNALENDLNKNLVPSDHMTVNRDKILDSLLGYLEGLDRQVDKPQYTYRLEARPRCFGRPDQVEELIGCWLQNGRKFILGPGGMGKSNLCLFSLHDERVISRFGDRRYFIRCDGDDSRAAVVAELAAALGVIMNADAENVVLHELAAEETLLVLDNFETPWERDTQPCEEFLKNLSAVPGISLAVTIRANTAPPLDWEPPIRIQPVGNSAGREIFLSIAGTHHASDPVLETLLTEMDGHPLSISLLAYQAQAENNLNRLCRRWQSKRAELLKRGTGDHKDLNLAASINLSVESPEMQPEGLDLLKILGQLPDGLGEKDLLNLFPETGDDAAANLVRLGLVIESPGRVRLLNPVREHTRAWLPPGGEQMDRLVAYFLRMAKEMGPKAGAEGGREAILELSVNWGNILNMLDIALAKDQPLDGIDAVIALAGFQVFSGLRDTGQLSRSAGIGEKIGDENRQANCIKSLGNIAYLESENEDARGYYEKALPMFEKVGDLLGQANCIKSLGDLSYLESENEDARGYYEKALPMFEKVGSLLGQANCIRSLGDLSYRESENEDARGYYEKALPMFEKVGDLLGQANCISSLGDLSYRESENEDARGYYEKALPMFEKVGDLLGQANCIKSLGDLSYLESENEDARGYYEKALPMFEKVGSLLGQANCIRSLGDLSYRESENEDARGYYEKALPMYEKIGSLLGQANCIRSLGDLFKDEQDWLAAQKSYKEALAMYGKIRDAYSIGWAHLSLSQVTKGKEQKAHREAARQTWEKAGYHRLIKENLSDD